MGVILRKWLVNSLFCIETKQHEKSKKKSIGITLYLVLRARMRDNIMYNKRNRDMYYFSRFTHIFLKDGEKFSGLYCLLNTFTFY